MGFSRQEYCSGLPLPLGFPGGSEVKASACNVGDLGSIPGLGSYPGEGNGNLLQYSCLENPKDGGAWLSPSSQGCKELDTTEPLHFTSLHCWVNRFLGILTLRYLDFKIKTKWVTYFCHRHEWWEKLVPWQKLGLSLIHSESHWIGELIWGLMVLNCLQLFFEHQSTVWTCSRNIVMCSLNPSNVSAEHTFSLHLQTTFQWCVAMKLSFGQWNEGKS